MQELLRLGAGIPVSPNAQEKERKIIDYFQDTVAQAYYEQQMKAYYEHNVEMPLSLFLKDSTLL